MMHSTFIDTFLQRAADLHCTVSENELLARHTTFRIGGPARIFAEVPTVEALVALRSLCRKEGVPHFILGNGSNLLVDDEGYDGVILHLSDPAFTKLTRIENEIYAGAGVKMSALTVFARDQGLSGLEFAHGIPGSVGGAAYMNAGAYGGELKDVTVSCDVVTATGTCETIPVQQLEMRYRHTALMNSDAVVTGIRLRLTPDDPKAIAARMEDYLERRKSKQPLEYPSAGSVFKRPEGYFAGALIEQCKLKGCTIGGAQVSEKHAGFIVNRGGATAKDVHELVAHIQETVLRETGVELECEILRLGNDPTGRG